MDEPRASNTATVLNDGRVLLTGGFPAEGQTPQATAETFDPATNRFTPVGPMLQARADQSATLLPDGRVLIAGGTDGRSPLDSTEYFDPTTDRFSAGPRLTSPRSAQAAVLAHGTVVLIGGTTNGHSAVATTDVLQDDHWNPGPRLLQPRIKHAAVLLTHGLILVVGGATSTEGRQRLDSTELLNLPEATSSPGPTLSQGEYKLDGALATLGDGRIAIAGGTRINVYDSATNTIDVLPSPPVPQYSFVTATLIGGDKLLIAGGYDASITPTRHARIIRIP